MGVVTSDQPSAVQVIDPSVPSLRANFQWTLAGNLIYALCQWGMLSVLAKAGSPAIVGQFALGLAIAAPIFMFTNLQLRAVQATDARCEFQFAEYFTLRVLASLAGFLVVIVLAAFLHYDLATRLVVVLVGASKMVESLSDVVAGFLQKHERLDQVAISLIIRGVFSLATFATVFLRTRNLVSAVVWLVLVWTLVFLLYDLTRVAALLSLGKNLFSSRSRELGRLLVVSAPLGVVMTLLSLHANIPRYALVKYLGEGDLGIFASMAYLLISVSLVVNALGQSATTRLAKAFAGGDIAGFWRVMKKLLALGAGILVFGTLFAAVLGRPLLTLLYRPEYGQNISVFVVLMATAGVVTMASFLGYGATAARSFRLQVPVVGVSTALVAALSYVFVPRFGLMGAAAALFIATIALALGYALILWRALVRVEVR